MLLRNIEPLENKILIQPTSENSSFSTENKKYERKAVGIIQNSSTDSHKIGEKVIYDDSHSVDFSLDGVSLSIIDIKDIVAIIKEDKNGEA